jgi:hypothetical protein
VTPALERWPGRRVVCMSAFERKCNMETGFGPFAAGR